MEKKALIAVMTEVQNAEHHVASLKSALGWVSKAESDLNAARVRLRDQISKLQAMIEEMK